jgi:protein-disulfide isomerase
MGRRVQRLTDLVIATMLVAALAIGGMRAYQYHDTSVNDPTKIKDVSDWRRYATGGHRLGPSSARVVVVEFADFQCPFCRRADSTLKRTRAQHPRDVAVVYRNYPIHEYAFVAAQAAECAAQQGAFESMHDVLYANADSIGLVPWERLADQAGVRDTMQLSRCLRDPRVAERIVADTIAAHELRVHGTPTFLINNLRVVGFSGTAAFDRVLALALSAASHEYGTR